MNRNQRRNKSIAVLILMIVLFVTGCDSFRSDIVWLCEDPPKYTKEEVKELFLNNREDFEEMVDIIFDNEQLLEHIREVGGGEGPVYSTAQKEYFTEEEWAAICNFYDEYKPYSIERTIAVRGGAVTFYFHETQFSSKEIHYIHKSDEGEQYCKRYWFETYEQLDENWWIVTGL